MEPWAIVVIVIIAALLLVFGVRYYVHRKTLELAQKHQNASILFEQTAEALANAIDAKDSYTNGHSRRVAEYSRKIAKEIGKSESECENIYFAALLHDVGKIGVPVSILQKSGKLTDEEFEQIKQHPVVGGQILSSIQQSPYLSIAARYHHERYDGRGYPEGRKGEDIPEIARIIAVADSYDAMSSNRSYRNAIPQHIVREELVEGIETQFDPQFAKAMIHLLDLDEEYRMREKEAGGGLAASTSIHCESIYHDCMEGIAVTGKIVRISFYCKPDEGYRTDEALPSMIIFDALDGRVHPGEENNKDLLYYEYACLRPDDKLTATGVRRVRTNIFRNSIGTKKSDQPSRYGTRYDVEAVKYRDHALVRITEGDRTIENILALPDSTRFVYISLSGKHCTISNVRVENDEVEVATDYIPRIAEEISYIKGLPEGDIPNVQVDGWHSAMSKGIPITDGMTLTFHTKSLPTARLVWHCPYISVFTSSDGTADGDNFYEFILLRLDGENWESDEHAENRVHISKLPEFEGWDVWKEKNKFGLDCSVKIGRKENVITMQTENLGIVISSETTILDEVEELYVALTGDQCAITNIRGR